MCRVWHSSCLDGDPETLKPLAPDRLEELRATTEEREALARALAQTFNTSEGFDADACSKAMTCLFEATCLESLLHRGGASTEGCILEAMSGLLWDDGLANSSTHACVLNSPREQLGAGEGGHELVVIDSTALDPSAVSTTPVPSKPLERTGTFEWRGCLAVGDLVQLAPGQNCSEALLLGEVGQVLCDARRGSAPFLVRGQRGKEAWIRGECIVLTDQDVSDCVCPRGHLLVEYSGANLIPLSVASCQKCGRDIQLLERRWRCDGSRQCTGFSLCVRCCRSRGRRRVRESQPLLQLVVRALNPREIVDFPALTDICEAAAGRPSDVDEAAGILVATLGQQSLKPGDIRNVTQDYLKVLTILNEMVHNKQVTAVLRCTPGLQSALERLRRFRKGDMGDSADENIRMLATEVDKAVFQSTGRAGRPSARSDITAFCVEGHLLRWKNGQGFFHVHTRSCAVCHTELPRNMERYNCRVCIYYDVCVACLRRGSG